LGWSFANLFASDFTADTPPSLMSSSRDILTAASDLVGRSLSERDFCSHFGGPSLGIGKLWEFILMRSDLPNSWGIENLLIGLFFYKILELHGALLLQDLHPNTLKKHLMWTMQIISDTLPNVNKKLMEFFLIYF
jgi:hypothetical protein